MRQAFLFFFVFSLCGAESGICAHVSIAGQTAAPGQTVVAPILFAADGESISGIQFDVEFDASLDLHFLPGAQVGQSIKSFYMNAISGRSMRLVVAGINRNAIGDGELVRLLLSAVPNAAPGAVQVRLTNIFATDPDGGPVAVSPAAATIEMTMQAAGGIQAIPSDSVLSAASLAAGPVCPGEIITLFANQAVSGLRFNGSAAPILYSGSGQVNAVVPVGLDVNAPAVLEVSSDDRIIATLTVPVTPVAPAIFTQSALGIGPGAILNQDDTVNSFDHPAQAGSIVALYGTGFGPLQIPGVDGQVAAEAVSTSLPVAATVGGLPAEVTYAGAAPGLITGLVQVNVRIPSEIAPTPSAPILLSIGSATTPAGVSVSVE